MEGKGKVWINYPLGQKGPDLFIVLQFGEVLLFPLSGKTTPHWELTPRDS